MKEHEWVASAAQTFAYYWFLRGDVRVGLYWTSIGCAKEEATLTDRMLNAYFACRLALLAGFPTAAASYAEHGRVLSHSNPSELQRAWFDQLRVEASTALGKAPVAETRAALLEFQRLEDPVGQAATESRLALLLARSHSTGEAPDLAQRAVIRARSTGYPATVASAATLAAETFMALGDHALGSTYALEAVTNSAVNDDRPALARALVVLGTATREADLVRAGSAIAYGCGQPQPMTENAAAPAFDLCSGWLSPPPTSEEVLERVTATKSR